MTSKPTIHRLTTLLLALLALNAQAANAQAAHGFTIIPTFDPSITANLSAADAASFVSAINAADAEFSSLFSDPITINITFKSNPGTSIFGQSNYSEQFISSYGTLKTDLATDAKSADDLTSIANLPAADPTGGGQMAATFAQAKALGIRTANDTATDGIVTIGAGYNFTYDPNNRAVSGKYDFMGIAEHEISEVMGRAGVANLGNRYGPLDFFGYQFGAGGTGTGTLNVAQNQDNNYFCIDGGHTPLKLNNNHSNDGDDKDWGSGSNDAFNASSFSGVKNGISAVDIREMDVIGYDLAAAPEPGPWVTFSVGGILLLVAGRKRSKSVKRIDDAQQRP